MRKVIEEKSAKGLLFQVVEESYEFGTHYVFYVNGEPGFHSTDLDRVVKYMNSWVR